MQEAQSSLKSVRALLEQREADLAAVQSALQALESEKRKLGESATTDKFSLELEVDRLRRDLQRCEAELERAREDVRDRERARREREEALDKLVRHFDLPREVPSNSGLHVKHDENRELSTQLAAQTQARLNLGEKLDSAQAVSHLER
jgi:SMC interacting uncharacterized protein involved in chromosome segregation